MAATGARGLLLQQARRWELELGCLRGPGGGGTHEGREPELEYRASLANTARPPAPCPSAGDPAGNTQDQEETPPATGDGTPAWPHCPPQGPRQGKEGELGL